MMIRPLWSSGYDAWLEFRKSPALDDASQPGEKRTRKDSSLKRLSVPLLKHKLVHYTWKLHFYFTAITIITHSSTPN